MSTHLKNYKYILAIDPSGSFEEGKGTTGWCVINNTNQIVECGFIAATDYDDRTIYWKEHENLIRYFNLTYKHGIVVFEDYLLYANKAKQQINSRLETPQLLGIMRYVLEDLKIPYHVQTAAEVKKRWSDDILIWKHILIRNKRGFTTIMQDGTEKPINRHIRDAIRHAIHYNTFKNNK